MKIRGLTSLLLGVLGLGLTAPGARADGHVGVSVGFRLPHGFAEISVGPDRYYVHRGVYYRRGPHGYVVVRAPRGAVIRALPPHPVRIYVGGSWYYRCGDVYYTTVPGGYTVVEPPVTVVQSAPPPAPEPAAPPQTIRVGGVDYVFKDGQFFQPTDDGLVWVEPPLGAVTKTLPADAQSVWYQQVEYFECDDVYFQKTPDGYKVIVAPWKK